MAYTPKIRNAATPVGTMRLAGRDQQDIKAATAAPSATGGAPTLRSDMDRIMDDLSQRTQGSNITPSPEVTPLPTYTVGLRPEEKMRFQQPADPQPILPKLRQQPIHDPDRYSATNPELVQQTESFIQDLMDRGHNFEGFSGPGEVAKYLHAAIYSEFEPHLRAPMPLADLVHQTREGRAIANFIRQGQANRVRYGGRAL